MLHHGDRKLRWMKDGRDDERWEWVRLRILVITLLVLVVAARATGVVHVGFVTSGSMEPTLPEGSIFLAIRGTPQEGDIVLFDAPDSTPVVHRVTAVTVDGLVTRGDANSDTDQDNGFPPIAAEAVAIVPHFRGEPVALDTVWLKPLGLGILQAGLFMVGILGWMRARTDRIARRRRGRTATIPGTPAGRHAWVTRPHIMMAAGGLLLLLAAPAFHDEATANGAVTITGQILPTFARVESDAGVFTATLPPMGHWTVEARGPTELVRAPSLPGVAYLAQHGAVAAQLPVTALFLGLALVMRQGGA